MFRVVYRLHTLEQKLRELGSGVHISSDSSSHAVQSNLVTMVTAKNMV